MSFQIVYPERFPTDPGHVSTDVQDRCRSAITRIQDNPYGIGNPKIKKLKKHTNIYRYKIRVPTGQYRLIYRPIKHGERVELLMLDRRDTAYQRLDNKATVRRTDLVDDSELFPPTYDAKQTMQEIAPSYQCHIENSPVQTTPQNSESHSPLPFTISCEFLRRCGIHEDKHECFLEVSTEDEILDLNCASQEEIKRVLDGIYPSSIKSLENQPKRTCEDFSDLLDAARGRRELTSFLLELDGEQKEFLNRLAFQGPWLLKGGPGTGRSICAIYGVKELEKRLVNQLAFNEGAARVLFTTYTKSLVSVSKHLLGTLKANRNNIDLDVVNYNSLANRYLTEEQKSYNVTRNTEDYIRRAIHDDLGTSQRVGITVDDYGFVQDEISSVILGLPCLSLEEYKRFDRKGRGRGLNSKQREFVWSTYRRFCKILRDERQCVFGQQVKAALKNAQEHDPMYDYVFIDEAQDFRPAALKLCTALVKIKTNVFLTADVNQTIYGVSIPWNRLTDGLEFRG